MLIFGLKGRLDRDVVYVHCNTDLSRMQLLAQTADPHSGLLTLQWTLGTHNLSNDLGSGAVGVQRLPNVVSTWSAVRSMWIWFGVIARTEMLFNSFPLFCISPLLFVRLCTFLPSSLCVCRLARLPVC